MNRERFVRILGMSDAEVDRWAKRHGLEPFTHPCYVCDRPCTTSIPFVVQRTGYRLHGLIAPVCECGHPTPPYEIVGPTLGHLFAPVR